MKTVILAGGVGARLWPLSRDSKPKQFHSFIGESTMLQQTFERLSFLKPQDIFISTNEQYKDIVKKQLPKFPLKNLIIEPGMRDTGPCICYAAHCLKKLGFGSEVMAIIYADHLVQKKDQFAKALNFAAAHINKSNKLGVIAVRAKYPNPNLGYIHLGPSVENSQGFEIYELDKFVEKPDLETAKSFMNSYKYLWNTGLYIWKIDTILEKFKKLAPKIYSCSSSKKTFLKSPKTSVDYAVMEKVDPSEVHVFPFELGWNDIGNWAALHEELADNETDNVLKGNNISIETKGSVIFGNHKKLIVTHGLKNMIVIDSDDVLLIMPKEKASEIKSVVNELKKKKKSKFV